MFNIDKFSLGLLFIGAALGTLLPTFAPPFEALNSSAPMIFLILGVVFLLMR